MQIINKVGIDEYRGGGKLFTVQFRITVLKLRFLIGPRRDKELGSGGAIMERLETTI